MPDQLHHTPSVAPLWLGSKTHGLRIDRSICVYIYIERDWEIEKKEDTALCIAGIGITAKMGYSCHSTDIIAKPSFPDKAVALKYM